MRVQLALAGVLVAGSVAAGQEVMYALTHPTSARLVTLDKTTGGQLTNVAVTGHEALFGGLAMDSAGGLYSIDGYNDAFSDRLFQIDTTTGAGSVIGETGHNWNFRNVCVHPVTDELWGSRDSTLYTIDRSTGAATVVTNVSGSSLDQMTTFAIGPDGVAYGTDIGDIGLFEIDLVTGAGTHLGNLAPGGSGWFSDLAFDENGVLWGVHSQNQAVYTIDVANAIMNFEFNGRYVGLTFSPTAADCPADFNGDGEVNTLDFLAFLNAYNAGDPRADFNGDGTINTLDFLAFLNAFNEGCD